MIYATDWIQTYTGKVFYPLEPLKCLDKICIEDIAWALSMKCRFNGHCKKFYSIAEHSVLVARSTPPRYDLEGLMHDASEAYLADIPRPVKRFIPNYHQIEKDVEMAIAEVFDLDWPIPMEVKTIDMQILHDEKLALMNDSDRPWSGLLDPIGIEIECWSQERAFREFMDCFESMKRWF